MLETSDYFCVVAPELSVYQCPLGRYKTISGNIRQKKSFKLHAFCKLIGLLVWPLYYQGQREHSEVK